MLKSITLSLCAVSTFLCQPTLAQNPTNFPKTMAQILGFSSEERVLIVHADDLGLCESINHATFDAMELGTVSSAAIIVPASGFDHAISRYKTMKVKPDVGVHANFTSDWNNAGWKPVAPATEVPSLVSPEGFLWKSIDDVLTRTTPEDIAKELEAQVTKAKSAGLDLSHVDSHMGILYFRPETMNSLIATASKHHLSPTVTLWSDSTEHLKAAFGEELIKAYEATVTDYVQKRPVALDYLYTEVGGETLEARRANYYKLFSELKPGISQILVDLGYESEELTRLAQGNPYAQRHQDAKIFTDPKTLEILKENKIRLISWRELNQRVAEALKSK